uniref:Pirin C-terminal domain-containing protein n=1 Tax=Strigamia maritima TaxID=126957 RepID=T1JG43_STRMM
MTAGQGIVHSEMPTDELILRGGQWEGFQLWVNLPARDKMMIPRYQDRSPDSIPTVTSPDGQVTIKVIAGEALGTKSSIETRTAILLLDIHLRPGASFSQEVNQNYNSFVYMWKGSGFFGGDLRPTKAGQVGILSNEGSLFYMRAHDNQSCDILLAAGEPINEPIVKYGPFVMNTQEEIEQVIQKNNLKNDN